MSIKNLSQKIILSIASVIFTSILAIFGFATMAYADGESSGTVFSLAPMNQMITLTPGETYEGNFQIINPGDNKHEFYYTIEVQPFTTANDGSISFSSRDSYNQIVDWITLYDTAGVVEPNENQEVRFAVHVPEDAPAGGQYATIIVRSGEYAVENSSVNLKEVYKADHLIYADVAGETVRRGSIANVNVPGFLFSGKITGSAMITNEGNVHSQATHKMQIFPLFSNEEVFTNEEDPKKAWIMPGNTSMSAVAWEETPNVGIFRVKYSVNFEGVKKEVEKLVIVCPLWLLFLIILALFLIVFRILSFKKKSKQ